MNFIRKLIASVTPSSMLGTIEPGGADWMSCTRYSIEWASKWNAVLAQSRDEGSVSNELDKRRLFCAFVIDAFIERPAAYIRRDRRQEYRARIRALAAKYDAKRLDNLIKQMAVIAWIEQQHFHEHCAAVTSKRSEQLQPSGRAALT